MVLCRTEITVNFSACTKSELLSCGRNTLSYVTNIVTTIKANMDECSNVREVSGDSGNEGTFVRTVITQRPGFSLTQVNSRPTTSETTAASKRNKHGRKAKKPRRSRPSSTPSFPSITSRCPPAIVRQASSICFPLLSSRSVKQALNPAPGEFILTKFTVSIAFSFN